MFGDPTGGAKLRLADILGVRIVRIETSLSGTDCRRNAARQSVVLAASALAIARSRSVVITDLSLEGAQLGGRDLPPPGDDVLIVVGSRDAMGTVVWCSGEKCGVHFDEALLDNDVVKMKKEADWTEIAGWLH
jgi:hypothetical protein